MKQLSDGALITNIRRLLSEGHTPKQIASSLDVSIVRLVKLVAVGAETTDMTTKGEHGWPVGVAVASEEVAMALGTDPQWDLSVGAQRVAPSARAAAPCLHGPAPGRVAAHAGRGAWHLAPSKTGRATKTGRAQ